MSKKAIVQPLAVRGLIRLLEKLTGMRVALSHPKARGICAECGNRFALRNDGTVFTHFWAGFLCGGSDKAAS